MSFPGPGDLMRSVRESQLWRSLFRQPYPTTSRTRALAVMNNVFLHLHPVRVKRHAIRYTYTFCLGGVSFFLFLVLTVTGLYLMFFYVPAVPDAYFDMHEIRTEVPFGQFMRNVHRWAAHLMLVVVFLHMVRVFYAGAYKRPRQFNWGIGVMLLVLTLFLSFTGYLLPWDQLAMWAVAVGHGIAGFTPVFGQQVQFIIFGGVELGPITLIRFYTLHVLGLPFILTIFLAVHFWRIRKDGGISGPL